VDRVDRSDVAARFGMDEPVYPLSMIDLFRKGVTLRAGVIGERRSALSAALAHLREHPWVHEHLVTHASRWPPHSTRSSRRRCPSGEG